MRMWNVDPRLMCRQHLLGEHLEVHMFMNALAQGKALKGYIEHGLVETHRLRERHAALVAEMKRRGYRHHSPMRARRTPVAGAIDVKGNLVELARRCPACAARQREEG